MHLMCNVDEWAYPLHASEMFVGWMPVDAMSV